MKDGGPAVIHYRVGKGQVREQLVAVSEIFFILAGRCRITFGPVKNLVLEKSQAILVAVGNHYTMEMLDDCDMFVCRIEPGVQLCETFSLKNLFPEKHKVKRSFSVLEMNNGYGRT